MRDPVTERRAVVEDRRIAVRVTPDALRHIRAGHPWVFDRSIVSASQPGAPGDLAVVFDDRRKFAAIGLWDPSSPIRLRVLHAGHPTTIDGSFFAARLDRALGLRATVLDDPGITGYRVVNGESDGFPGLVVDRYADTLVVKLYTPAWFAHLDAVVTALTERLHPERIVLRLSRGTERGAEGGDPPDGAMLLGSAPTGPIEFLECGLRFGVDVIRGPKTGHFLDQRENRALVGTMAGGRAVLDVFCSTGGFTVHAAAGGATSVDGVDISRPALEAAMDNLHRNEDRADVAACRHRVHAGDAFEVLGAFVGQRRQWDLVVVDPPSFAPRQDAVPAALRAYARLTELGLAVTRTGGTFVQSSCSARIDAETFHAQIDTVARRAGVTLHDLARTGHPVDHPATIPEARYLKTRFAKVQR